MHPPNDKRPNKTDAGNGSKAICRVSIVLRSPSPDPGRSAQKMATIFTRAKAAKKAIDLIDLECGIPRSRLRCDSRLESDLGIAGDDTYSLLEAMHENGVDMSRFDCHDRITPEGQDAVPILIYFGLLTACVFVFFVLFPNFSSWMIVPVSLAGAYFASRWIYRFLPDRGHEELRVRDLVLSFEAGHWISPKAEQDGGGQSASRPESK
ncbi:MAG: hypothetical protein ACKVY0_10435 [Prosthecobacter sp.]|uniref:hypothetical protein n=1 Tax=Prosthecobacter sp. TaxID=1965333 RepID=UPI003902B308